MRLDVTSIDEANEAVAVAVERFGRWGEGVDERVLARGGTLPDRNHDREPGFFRTGLASPQALVWPDVVVDDYAERSAVQRAWWQAQDGQQPGDPDKPEQVEAFAKGLDNYAEVLEAMTGRSVASKPGGGASGGLGAGLHAFCNAKLVSRWDVVTRYVNLDGLLDDADLVLTAEGALDAGSAEGKLPAELGRRAWRHRRPPAADERL